MNETAFPTPKCTRYSVRFSLEKLNQNADSLRVRFSHVRERNGALVCAEGAVFARQAPCQIETFFSLGSDFAVYEYPAKKLHTLGTGVTRELFAYPRASVQAIDGDGVTQVYVVSDDRVYRLTENGMEIASVKGGTCACVHRERLFVGDGRTLRYSLPIDLSVWTDRSPQATGDIFFADGAGEIAGVFSLRDKLYLVREYGITVLTADADPLSYRAEQILCDAGKTVAGSVAVAGEGAFFFTERGLHYFDGARVSRAAHADDGEIDFSKSLSAVASEEKYCACVRLKDGSPELYVYENGRGRHVHLSGKELSAGRSLYFSRGDKIFALSERAAPEWGNCALAFSFSLGNGRSGNYYAEAVTVEGKGAYTVKVVSESGARASVKAKGDCRARLPKALRGCTFRIEVVCEDGNFELCAVNVHARREL